MSKFRTGDQPELERLEGLKVAAEELRANGRHFAAGYAMSQGVRLAWGDINAMQACVDQASEDFERVVEDPTSTPFEALAALQTWGSTLSDVVVEDVTRLRESRLALDHVLAQLLTELASLAPSEHERTGYLIRGLKLSTDFRGDLRPEFPEYEVDRGLTSFNSAEVTLRIPGAFGVLVRLGDYTRAQYVAESCPDSFVTPGLSGWRAAVAGFIDPADAVECFAEASEHFASDTPPGERTGEGWSSINIHLWSKYFRARAEVAQIIRTPEQAGALIRSATASLEGTESGWVDPHVTCFRVVLQLLDSLFSEDHEVVDSATREQLDFLARSSGVDESNTQALLFLDEMAAVYEDLREQPELVLVSGSLRSALDTLGRIPLFGQGVAEAVVPYAGTRAYEALQGQHLTWIFRTLEGIRPEDSLRQILLRLFQATVPYYAHIRHGAMEYGKDIAVLCEDDGSTVLVL